MSLGIGLHVDVAVIPKILLYQIPNACHTHCLILAGGTLEYAIAKSWSKEGCGYTTTMGPLMRPIRPRSAVH